MTADLRLTRRAALLAPLAASLAGCGLFDWITDEEGKRLPGAREPVLSPTRGLEIDAVDPVTLPPVTRNADWTQYFGAPSHTPGNLAGGLTRAWRAEIGEGGAYRARLTAQPIVADGVVFTMDSDAAIAAFSLSNGARRWRTRTAEKKSKTSNLGGGIAYADGTLYAATGRGELIAIAAADGHILWRAPLPAPARSAPTIVGSSLYLTTLGGQLVALDRAGGKRRWAYQANVSVTGVLSQASPAFASDLVVAGFESGDLAAVRADSGTVAWSDNLGALKGTAGLAEFATVRGAPVVENGLVYAIGLGGLFACLDLRSGRRVWERDIGGANTPWLAGDVLYVLSADQRLAAVTKADGSVHWVTEMPRFKNPKRTKGIITWVGPALIGGKLLLLSDNGRMAAVDPITGSIVSNQELDEGGSVTPMAASGHTFVLTDDARLTAYT